ncbi:extracellular solute-binding protein [Actinomycetaceae bacterium TAE3-ERU4]|nr:extracellular solute-binding protein [Actinomycetaceae bacterium TAE3-ERU4]
MRITKKATALMAVLAVSTMGMVACSGDAAKDGGKTASPAMSAEKPGEKVTLTYLHRLPDKDEMIKVAESVKRFNAENPGIEIVAQKFSGKANETYPAIHKAVEAGEPAEKGFCLAQVGYGEIASEYVAGDLEDVSAETAQYEKDFYPGAMGMMKLGNVTVGLPQDVGPLVYVYDKAAFDKLGITPPKTWDEFAAAAEKAKAAGKYISSWQADETHYRLSGLAASNGATWFSPEGDKWKIDVNGDKTKQIAEKIQGMLDKDLLYKTASRWAPNFDQALKDGKLIGSISAGWEPGFMLGALGVEKADWRVTGIPTMDGNPATGSDGGSGIAVLKGCKHKAEAVKFAHWYNTQVKDLGSQGLVIATNVAVPETPANVKDLFGGQDVMKELAEQAKHMNPNFPYLPTWPAVSSKMDEVGGNVVKGEAKVADVFSTAQQEAINSMKAANLPFAE